VDFFDLFLIFWLVVLAISLLCYLSAIRKKEDRQRRNEEAVQRERWRKRQQESKEQQEQLLELQRQQLLEQQRQQLLEPQRHQVSGHIESEIKERSERLPPEEKLNWLQAEEQFRKETEQWKRQQEQQQLEPEGQQELGRMEPKKSASDITLDQTGHELIPESVRNEVWRRDRGRCTICGSNENLEFDLINPDSENDSSAARNLHLLCKNCKWSIGASI